MSLLKASIGQSLQLLYSGSSAHGPRLAPRNPGSADKKIDLLLVCVAVVVWRLLSLLLENCWSLWWEICRCRVRSAES